MIPSRSSGSSCSRPGSAVGVHLTLKQATADAVNELSIKNKIDAWISTYYAIYPTAIDLISQYWESDGAANYTHYKNAAGRHADRAGATHGGSGEARRAAREGRDARRQRCAGVFLENVNWLMGRNPDRLKNFNYSGVYGTYYDRLWVSG